MSKHISIDKYTKILLTIIALMLTLNILMQITPFAFTDKYNEVISVRIVGIDESPSEYWEAIPVRIDQ